MCFITVKCRYAAEDTTRILCLLMGLLLAPAAFAAPPVGHILVPVNGGILSVHPNTGAQTLLVDNPTDLGNLRGIDVDVDGN